MKKSEIIYLRDLLTFGCIILLFGTGIFFLWAAVGNHPLKSIILPEISPEEASEPLSAPSGHYILNDQDMLLYRTYKDYNEDVVGYIRIKDTVLDHPMMQTPDDEEYYLYRDLNKNYNSHGVPFLSSDSQIEAEGTNMVVYGHNIHKLTSDVFCVIAEYEDITFYKKHPIIETISESGTRRWLIFCYFIVDNSDQNPFPYSDYTTFLAKQDFLDFMTNVRIRNWLNVDVSVDYGDSLITLSSCSRELSGEGTNRMVLMGKLLNNDEDYEEIVANAKMTASPLLPEKLRK